MFFSDNDFLCKITLSKKKNMIQDDVSFSFYLMMICLDGYKKIGIVMLNLAANKELPEKKESVNFTVLSPFNDNDVFMNLKKIKKKFPLVIFRDKHQQQQQQKMINCRPFFSPKKN